MELKHLGMINIKKSIPQIFRRKKRITDQETKIRTKSRLSCNIKCQKPVVSIVLMRVNKHICIYKDFENDVYISSSQLRNVLKLKFMSSKIMLLFKKLRENKAR